MNRLARLAAGLGALISLWAIAVGLAQAIAPLPSEQSVDPLSVGLLALVMLIFPLLTGLILFRQPRNLIGWLLLAPQVILAASFIGNYYLAAVTTAPNPAPLPLVLLLWFLNTSWIPFIYSIVLLSVFFPTGQPPSPRWWWLVGALLVHGGLFIGVAIFGVSFGPEDANWSVANPIGFVTAEQFGVLFQPWVIGLAAGVVLCLAALVVRYRRAGAVERTQIRWLLYSCCLFVLIYLPQLFVPLETPSGESTPVGTLLNTAFGLALLLIPTSIVIAILRYRLWDIDVIIRRTLVYSVLTALLAAAYFGSVLVLQNAFQAVTGESRSALVTVLSTLFIAALFGPLRARIQRVIDQRFFRRKYDAARTLAAFGAQARDVVALDELSRRLEQAVDDTMQPASVSLWVRDRA